MRGSAQPSDSPPRQPSPPPRRLPGRHEEGRTPHPQLPGVPGESAVTQGSACGPSALAVAGDPHGEEPPRLGP